MTICKLTGISEKILRFCWRFSKRPLKNQSKFYISCKKNISTSYIHKMSSIKRQPHKEKSFWNYTPKLVLQRLLSNLHQRISFSQWKLHVPSATEKQTNIECQNLLLLILPVVSNSRRYSLTINTRKFLQCYFWLIYSAIFWPERVQNPFSQIFLLEGRI